MKSLDKDNPFKPEILFSDNHICVVVKPPGMVVPIENHQVENLEGHLKKHFQKVLNKETVFLKPIHRIDKPVGGIVIFARSSKALKRLQEAQRLKQIEKFYLAKVHGKVKQARALLTHLLVHGDHRAEIDFKNGKESQLRYQKVTEDQSNSLLSIRLLTGRYHQIRIQLSAIGHPIIGDIKYGSNYNFMNEQILLYHTKITFPHPTTQKNMVFCVRPDYF